MTDNRVDENTDELGAGEVSDQHSASRRELLKTVGVAPLFGEETSGSPSFVEQSEHVGTRAGRTTSNRVPGRLQTRFSSNDRPRFGSAVALDEGTAVVGVPPEENVAEPGTGIVAVFTHEGGSWRRSSTITPGKRASGGDFGAAVAVAGTTVIVGAPLPSNPLGPHGGTVTVFDRDGGTWRRSAELSSDDPSGVDRVGASVALNDDVAIVGAPADVDGRGDGTGAAYVFTRAAGRWKTGTKLIGDDGVDEFGRSVTLDGDVAVVGARRIDGGRSTDSGVAFVYERSNGRWTKQTELTPGDGVRDDSFGAELETNRRTVLVGAPTETNAVGPNAGAAYVFARPETRWDLQAHLINDQSPSHQFGTAIALEDGLAIVGGRSGAGPVVFARSRGRWERNARLGGEENRARGTVVDVALNGQRALLGVDRDAAYSDRSDGIVEVFEP
jgi:hypothetical protein